MNSQVQWVKLSTGLFESPKILRLRLLPQGDKRVLLWIMLLVLAGKANQNGGLFVTENMPYDLKLLAKKTDLGPKFLAETLEHFVRLNMIKEEDGIWYVRNWEKYQSVERLEHLKELNRARVKKFADKKKAEKSKKTNAELMHANAPEEEREEEKEKEIESHAFNHARARELAEKKRELLGGSLGQGMVMLSGEQMDDLLERLSLEEFDRYVAIVRDQEKAGKHYRKKTHYQAILEMAEKDRGLA